ncbi:uncharacterized protein LOC107266376 isoform X2 [Cephus cinctus]|nr:uncharacterized protein LOC107266376 isoform X2 [Cephus cinctus]XP_015592284.1 uncharacterized protein LOC107266376 isoform X2 [Cephus cinctus]XP_015592285.1 uncharacterized protein LOC107266376 isoform X2 [Cephus cinctus]XP_015592286.1 uncharacterized protein LOC107266376 isoform X2 [Cephus cinctus]XP_024939451.1 uncharacterized protein LOC107266376 isoform X2 [Cephus cinctus]XP_024939452.1 uncharacterized protein LOC107266376 isoform X2 [Cephus cinctus]XP_024939453.1 uncharacterized prot
MADRLNHTRLLEKSLPRQSRVSRLLQELPSSNFFSDIVYLPEEDYDEEFERREQELQQLERNDRNLMPEYRNLCEIKTRKVQLNDGDFEYQPPHYHEVFCKVHSFLEDQPTVKPAKQKCAHPGFHCVQRSRTLFMLRRAWDSECWEPFTKEIASGCDCMWPVSTLGDITAHY